MSKLFSKHFTLIAVLILFAALTRIIPHYPNFTAMGAMALFGAAHLKNKWQVFLLLLGAMYLSDLFINNVIYAEYYNGFVWKISPFVYLAFLLIIGIGYLLRGRVNVQNVVGASLSSSLVFFLLTNAATWQVDPVYTKDFAGLMTAYVAGLPFFWGTLAGDLFYCGVLFGGYAWFTQRYPQWGVALR
ncbi:MAG: DUF6580 family putative transport protein [Bacteroidota bacterium]